MRSPDRRSLPVAAVEAVGAYTLLRLRREGLAAGGPGQFFMLQADPEPPDAYLPRALSPAWADEREIAFLIEVRGAGTQALASARRVAVLGPFGHGFRPAAGGAVLVGGGIGAAVLPWLRRMLAARPGAAPVTTLLGFRSERHAACAALVDAGARVVLEPELVTEPLARMLPVEATVYACGPDPMLRAVAALCAEHDVPCQLAMEAAMACGYGGCHGCAVRIDGAWKRLCIEGPVLESRRVLA